MKKQININFLDFDKYKNEINDILKSNPNFNFSTTNYDYLVCFGGDGTFVNTLRNFYNKKINIILYPKGNLNFFGTLNLDIDQFQFSYFNILEIDIDNVKYFSINELILTKINSTSKFTICLNNDNLYSFQGSGFYCCTTMGSSGFNRSCGGPLFFDNNLYCYNELFVAKNKNNKFLDQPLMLSNQHLNIINTENNNDEFQLKIDGNSYVIKNWKNISIKLTNSCAKINLSYLTWLEAIKTKLI